MTDIHNPLPSPGVGARRKGPKSLPRLPHSAFTPPNSGAAENFPFPSSPSALHPCAVIDARVSLKGGKLHRWSDTVDRLDSRRVDGIVLALPAGAQQTEIDQIPKDYPSVKIISVVVPVSFDQGPLSQVPSFAGDIQVSLSIQFFKNSPQLVEGLKWALGKGYIVDIDVRAPVKENGEGWEGLDELLVEVLGSEDDSKTTLGGAIIISNILPPPHDLSISIVKMLNHPSYHSYQASIASLSLFPSVFVRYSPPNWGIPVPVTPRNDEPSKEKSEWKRKIKMFLSPVVEAFGYQRIIYSSSDSFHDSDSSDWYEISRESFAELGVDQDGVDAVFGSNAAALYGA